MEIFLHYEVTEKKYQAMFLILQYDPTKVQFCALLLLIDAVIFLEALHLPCG